MNIQRLKFARARGARIQFEFDDKWNNISTPGFYPGCRYRVHPNDEHLQYGPISAAFRDLALFTDAAELPEIAEIFMGLVSKNWQLNIGLGPVDTDDLTCDFARLFVAEYLADEGL